MKIKTSRRNFIAPTNANQVVSLAFAQKMENYVTVLAIATTATTINRKKIL